MHKQLVCDAPRTSHILTCMKEWEQIMKFAELLSLSLAGDG